MTKATDQMVGAVKKRVKGKVVDDGKQMFRDRGDSS